MARSVGAASSDTPSSRQSFSPFAAFQGHGLVKFKAAAKQVDFSVRKDGRPYISVRSHLGSTSSASSVAGASTSSAWRPRSSVDEASASAPALPATQVRVASSTQGDGDELPAIDAGRAAWLQGQSDFLQSELAVREEQLAQIRKASSDSVLVQDEARACIERSRVEREHHRERAVRLNEKIRDLREEIATQDNVRKILAGSRDGKTPPTFHKPEVSLEDSVLNPQKPPAPVNPAYSRGKGHWEPPPCEWLRSLGEEMRHERNSISRQPIDWAEDDAVEATDTRPPAERAESHRAELRRLLLKSAGSAREAFRAIDLNGSGNITLQEFADGLDRLGVDWKYVTRLRRPAEVFKLFDQARDWRQGSAKEGVITFRKLFPKEAKKEERRKKGDVDEFWRTWCSNNSEESFKNRKPKWTPENLLKDVEDARARRQEVSEKKGWMSESFRRMKDRDWTDAQCRELVAVHLRKGKGGKKRDDCTRFNEHDVFASRKAYTDTSNDLVKTSQRAVYDMRETRRLVGQFRQQLKEVSKGGEDSPQPQSNARLSALLKPSKDGDGAEDE